MFFFFKSFSCLVKFGWDVQLLLATENTGNTNQIYEILKMFVIGSDSHKQGFFFFFFKFCGFKMLFFLFIFFFSNVQLKNENFPKTFVATEQKFAKKKKHWV
jgi:uncharacterized membrane protein YagU involved in acid resistance